MALTGCHEHIIKEFNYTSGGIAVRLVQGFDNDEPAYYAICKRTGLNLPMGHEKYGCIESWALACTQENYAWAAKHFKSIVQEML